MEKLSKEDREFLRTVTPEKLQRFFDCVDFVNAVNMIPVQKPAEPVVCYGGIDFGPGLHQKGVDGMTCGYDYLYTELCRDRDAEKAKARRQRSDARKHKELPKDRKHRREMRKDRLYGYYYGECIKVAGNPDSLPINHRRDAEAERILRDDYNAELYPHEHRVGETTLKKQIERKWEEMIQIKLEFLSSTGTTPTFGSWAETSDGELRAYPSEYYQLQTEMEELESYAQHRFELKLEKGRC